MIICICSNHSNNIFIAPRGGYKDLTLVLDDSFYMVPFAVLRSAEDNSEYLSERCSLITVPSLQTLRQKSKVKPRGSLENINSALVVGGPRIPPSITESFGWVESSESLQEAAMVSDMLHAKALLSLDATKENVLIELPSAECAHFSTNLCWKTGALVLSPSDVLDSQSQKRFYTNSSAETENEDDVNDSRNMEVPPLSEFLLNTKDISNMKLNAKLIVLSAYQSLESPSGASVANLATAWLNAGAGTVLLSLWPVPETASKILLRAFYSALLQGTKAARYISIYFLLFCYLGKNGRCKFSFHLILGLLPKLCKLCNTPSIMRTHLIGLVSF